MCGAMAKGSGTQAVPGFCAMTLKKALPSAPSASWDMAAAACALGCSQKEKSVPRGCPLMMGLGSTRRCL